MVLGGPVAAGWVALLGTTEVRELRGRIPWYGTLVNHAGIALPAILGGLVAEVLGGGASDSMRSFVTTMAGAGLFFALNVMITAIGVGIRDGQSIRSMVLGETRAYAASVLALAPLAWLMAEIFKITNAGWWATLLFALPLYTTRVSHHRFVEMREMFTQTIESLANAVDKRDPFTSNHSKRVMLIASDIGREMSCSDQEMEALEWGGLLHDIGKIGVRDEILLKQEKLTREERIKMNAHPELGAEIIAPVRKLAPELPIIRHHHEWYNGSGYPDRLIGDEIPWLARILHVADAFEAMTAQRPYRMTPLTVEQALSELRKFAGIQFDPAVVDAFVRTNWVDGVPDPGRTFQPRPIPLLAQAAGRMTQATALADPGATPTDVR
jgi:putative nucleotidyltransferase with HDIG domain